MTKQNDEVIFDMNEQTPFERARIFANNLIAKPTTDAAKRARIIKNFIAVWGVSP